jgi:hypothetical protein
MGIENIQTAAGAKVSISATLPATMDSTGFDALTYTLIGEVTDAGEVGGTYGEVTHVPLDSRLVQRLKTSFDAGMQTLQLAVDPDDAGQGIALTALHSDDMVAIEVELADGTLIQFIALVMSFPINIGSVDTIVNTSISLAINSYPLVTFPA